MTTTRKSVPRRTYVLPDQRKPRASAGLIRAGIRMLVVLLVASCVTGWVIAGQNSAIDQRLRDADALKSSNYSEYVGMLDAIERDKATLSASQLQYFHYLRGWERGYAGDYDAGDTAVQIRHGRIHRPGTALSRNRESRQ